MTLQSDKFDTVIAHIRQYVLFSTETHGKFLQHTSVATQHIYDIRHIIPTKKACYEWRWCHVSKGQHLYIGILVLDLR
jgi:hypothetical protein